ncbi:uncharacterized protein [Triticum aestivum]|uniref:uncharacterized protein isoform X2 n=1 Tax=Triticum aestivum TaxID=4565 RepID=UPI001D019B7B|nr:uncharacterized protein LOC123111205 isoform X2 [Triticum aestivum]
MASADLLRREEEFYESLFDSAKGDAAAAKTRGQMIERKIEALEDMATKERIRAFIEDTTDKDVLVLNVQDPFQRLLLHGVCEFYNVTSTTTGTVQDGKPWKTTTIKKRSGTGVAPMITLVSFLRTKKNGSHVVS